MDKCSTCFHKNICMMRNQVVADNVVAECGHYKAEGKVHVTPFALYDTVYIIDRFDVDNNCSQYGDGTGSKNIDLVVRKCFVTNISINDKSGNYLYYLQPHNLTENENGIKSHYWDQGWYIKSIFTDEEAAISYLKECGWKDIKSL